MRWLGALLIISAAGLIGWLFARRLRERPVQIRQLVLALEAIETEITYGLTPLPVLIRTMEKRMPLPVRHFFTDLGQQLGKKESDFYRSWKRSVDEFWERTALKEAEKDVYLQFGKTLGQHDSISEKKQIRLAVTHLNQIETEARLIQQQYEKMYQTLGILAGILLSLILL